MFHLYVILDIFSRYVVGWMIAMRETAQLAQQLIGETIQKQNIAPATLTVHADRGSSMRSKLVAELLVDLDVARSHSRPYVSDDNPFSESQFRTLKYGPNSLIGSAQSKIHVRTARTSFSGTTRAIAIPGSH